MDTPLDTLLQKGISAVQDGQAEQARSYLLRVIEIDKRNVQAWYWLSRAVETAHEREICLENVLALDPAHTAVQAELSALRRERVETDAAALLSKEAVEAATPHTDDEWLIASAVLGSSACPYCGASTGAEDRQCPACGQTLYTREHRRAKHSVYSLGLVAIWFALANYVWIGLVAYYFFSSLSSAAANSTGAGSTFQTLAKLLGIEGSSISAPDLPLALILLGGGGLFVFSLVVAWGLYRRLRFFYWLTVACILIYPLFVIYRALAADSVSLLPLAINGLLFLAAIAFAFMAYDEFSWDERRLDTEVDRDVDSHSALYARGRKYAGLGMWAKAAAHWAKAAALSPGNPDYRLALASAYLHLGQPERAIEHLDTAQQIDPDNPEVKKLLARAASQSPT